MLVDRPLDVVLCTRLGFANLRISVRGSDILLVTPSLSGTVGNGICYESDSVLQRSPRSEVESFVQAAALGDGYRLFTHHPPSAIRNSASATDDMMLKVDSGHLDDNRRPRIQRVARPRRMNASHTA
jgi:hypothetical protein